MGDNITQMRLSMRLDNYLKAYTEDNVRKGTLSTMEWDTAWRVADGARAQDTLTPEIVDNVRIALHNPITKIQ